MVKTPWLFAIAGPCVDLLDRPSENLPKVPVSSLWWILENPGCMQDHVNLRQCLASDCNRCKQGRIGPGAEPSDVIVGLKGFRYLCKLKGV